MGLECLAITTVFLIRGVRETRLVWRDYRLLAAEHVLYPMRWWMSDLPQDFWGRFVRPALSGFRDLGCAQLLR